MSFREDTEAALGIVTIQGVADPTGKITAQSGDSAGRVILVSDDIIRALWVESTITNLLLAQRFGVSTDELDTIRADLYMSFNNGVIP